MRRQPEVPHFAAQFELTAEGPVCVEQDSPEDVAACVYRVCVCPEGYREDLPEFGIPEMAFGTVPLPLGALEDAIIRWEPRAELTVEEQAEARDVALRQIGIEVA